MREWLREWGTFVRFLLIVGFLFAVIVGGIGYLLVTGPKDCHVVYVQTTPVDGQPAMERRDICR